MTGAAQVELRSGRVDAPAAATVEIVDVGVRCAGIAAAARCTLDQR